MTKESASPNSLSSEEPNQELQESPTTQSATDDDHTAPTSVEAGRTKFGKKLTIRRTGNGQLFVIDMDGGGTHPKEIRGHYTRFSAAEDAIKAYEAKVILSRRKGNGA